MARNRETIRFGWLLIGVWLALCALCFQRLGTWNGLALIVPNYLTVTFAAPSVFGYTAGFIEGMVKRY
jgi:hypothetical protein